MSKNNSNDSDLRVKRTNYLLREALFELLTNKSFNEINVTDICDTAMVHRATFYKHYVDKYDLADYSIQYIKDYFFNVPIDITDNNLQSYYLLVLDKMLTFIDENKVKVKNIFDHNKEGYFYLKIVEALSKNINIYLTKCIEKRSSNEHSLNIPTEAKSYFLSTGITSLTIWWVEHINEYSKKDIHNYIHRIMQNNLN